MTTKTRYKKSIASRQQVLDAAMMTIASKGFAQIGGHQRKHIENVSNNHLTSFWENESLSTS